MSHAENLAFKLILEELSKAEKKWTGWPENTIDGVAIIAEELGESVKAALQFEYGHVPAKAGREKLMEEVAQTGAMALRMLIFLIDQRAYPEMVPGKKE